VGGTAGPVIESEIVTGERLQALADVILLPGMLAFHHRDLQRGSAEVIKFVSHRELDQRKLDRVAASRSIFVYTEAIDLFQEHVWPRLTGSDYVLITHNSDHEVGREQLPWVEHAGERLAHWFAQNLVVEHPKISPLPIGLANRRWPHGNVELLCQAAMETEELPRSELIHAAFDLGTHPDRKRAWDALRAAFPEFPRTPCRFLSFAGYLHDLARHRFCACPRGNGIDTHRFWESLYLGVVPVVERSTHAERWAREGVPMVLLDDWSELSRERLESDPLAKFKAPRPACLFLSYYARLLDQLTDPTMAVSTR
jgi:hypothetical protein